MADYILRKAKWIIQRCHSRDPFEIARILGIHVFYRGDFTDLKGMYAVVKRNRFIFLNGNLPKQTQIIVCAHELGHDALHRDLARDTILQETMLYDMTLKPEYEANLFAAHILLDEDAVLELMQAEMDMQQIAAHLQTDVDLLHIKIRDMQRRKIGL